MYVYKYIHIYIYIYIHVYTYIDILTYYIYIYVQTFLYIRLKLHSYAEEILRRFSPLSSTWPIIHNHSMYLQRRCQESSLLAMAQVTNLWILPTLAQENSVSCCGLNLFYATVRNGVVSCCPDLLQYRVSVIKGSWRFQILSSPQRRVG